MSESVSLKNLWAVLNEHKDKAVADAKKTEDYAPMGPLVAALRYQYLGQIIHEAIARDEGEVAR